MAKTTANTSGKTISMIFGIACVCILLAAGWSFWKWNVPQKRSNNMVSQPVPSMAVEQKETAHKVDETRSENPAVPTDHVAQQPAEPVESEQSTPVSHNAQVGRVETGMASYYTDALHGNPTASGEPYDKTILTAAHREHPFGTRVRVTNLKNGKSVIVRINDRGPHTSKSIVDISRQAAQEIDLITIGTTEVELEVLQ